ncbi:sce7726 family protein [Oceanitalea stevensii]|uniref:Sce7726 family protein n=1 Tax=Oceanitalea stevensii TaxID=2763072 RepID=A0ABR8YY91_9MICO|nr:sce7726 family protein [Oceanitalea stevensii]MBD8061020.1 sce7726 family protein [Oceanitalea stevensii]
MRRDQSELSALSRLFSATVFRELAKQGHSQLAGRLLSQSRLPQPMNSSLTLSDVLDQAFQALKVSGCRDEYVYRSALINKIVLGRHSLRTATVLNELRAGRCKVDAAVLNGTSTAYEIKSERDSLGRLADQVENYRNVFASVNILTSSVHLKHVLSTMPEDVGVMVLTDRYTLRTVRTPKNLPERTSPTTILESLRSNEAASVLGELGIRAPSVPNTQLREALREEFSMLDPIAAHGAMVSTLKRTRSQYDLSSFINRLPPSLRAAGLATKLNAQERARIIDTLNAPAATALHWS